MKVAAQILSILCILTSASYAQYAVKLSTQFISFGTHLRADSVYTTYIDVTSDQDVMTYVHMGSGRYNDTRQQETWCEFEPLNFPLPGRATQRVQVRVQLRDSSGLKFSQYFPVHTSADGFTSDESFLVIQIKAQSLNVRPRHLSITPDSLDFGDVRLDTTVQRTFTFYSPDSASIYFDREPPGYEFTAPGSYPTNPITDSVVVTVSFTPMKYPGEHVTYMAVAGNTDPEGATIALRAHVDTTTLGVDEDVAESEPRVGFESNGNIKLLLTKSAHIEVYDVLGEQLQTADLARGEHSLQFRGSVTFCFVVIDSNGRHVYKLTR